MTELVRARYRSANSVEAVLELHGDPFDVCNAVAGGLGLTVDSDDPVFGSIMEWRKMAAQAADEKAGSTPARSQRLGETGGRFESGVVDSGEPKARPATAVSGGAESPSQSVDLFAAPAVGVRGTSLEAHRKLKASGKLTAQQEAVVAWLRGRIGDATRQEIAKGTGIGINAVAGRCKELLDAGVLVENARRACRITSETANPLRLADGA